MRYFKEFLKKKTILITLPILILLIVALIMLGISNAAGNTAEPETDQTFTEEGDGYYIWVRAVDHAGNKGPWSEAQRVWIDTGAPKITIKTNSNTTWAQTGSVTVALQDSKSGLAAGAKLKYGWSTSNSTAPSKYTDVTPSYTAGTTSEVTFTASASGLTGKYYLWVVPTTLADTAGNSQTTTAKSTGTFYFDNQGPSAPTITGGSTSWATSRTISVSTASTDSGVGTVSYYEYYKASNNTAPTASTSGTKVTTSDNSVTFSTNIAGDYVYFRGVDSLGNKGTWSSYQRVYIDINKPTVTASASTITMTVGERSDTFASLFTVAANGNNTSLTTTYTLNGSSTTGTTTLASLAAGTYTLQCTASKNGGNSSFASIEIQVKNVSGEITGDYLLYATEEWDGETFTVPSDTTQILIMLEGWDGSYCFQLWPNNTSSSSRLIEHYGSISGNIEMFEPGYRYIVVEVEPGETYGTYGYFGSGYGSCWIYPCKGYTVDIRLYTRVLEKTKTMNSGEILYEDIDVPSDVQYARIEAWIGEQGEAGATLKVIDASQKEWLHLYINASDRNGYNTWYMYDPFLINPETISPLEITTKGNYGLRIYVGGETVNYNDTALN